MPFIVQLRESKFIHVQIIIRKTINRNIIALKITIALNMMQFK
jgi:hypothetical protein